jgi:catalase
MSGGRPTDVNYLFDDLIARLAEGPVQWRLVATIGTADDASADATVAWPDSRQRVTLGTLTINRIATEQPGNCSDVNFDPLVLPAGIAPSDDPLLSARSATYSNSYRRRAAEAKTPSEVQVPLATKDATP